MAWAMIGSSAIERYRTRYDQRSAHMKSPPEKGEANADDVQAVMALKAAVPPTRKAEMAPSAWTYVSMMRRTMDQRCTRRSASV